jgi:hypothetical protein
MKFSPRTPHSQIKSRNSFRRTLLRRRLHQLSAVTPATCLDGITYRQIVENSRKSFRRLLLPLFVPVSPLGAHSYRKIGGGGPRKVQTGDIPDRIDRVQSFTPLGCFDRMIRF